MCVCVCVCACARVCARAQLLHCVRLFVTPWTVVCQAALPMDFSRQEDWNGVSFPTPGHLPNPGIEHESLCVLHCRQILYH